LNIFEQPRFWGLAFAAGAAFWALPPARTRSRAAILGVAGILFALLMGLSPQIVGLLVASAGWTCLGMWLTRRLVKTRPTLAAWVVFGPTLLAWIVGKQAKAQDWDHLSLLFFVGFSFFLVKTWTLIRDVHEGVVRPRPLHVLAYLLYFPAYLSGPMQYYAEFDEALQEPQGLDAEGLLDVVFRTALGLVKIRLLVPLLTPVSLLGTRSAGVDLSEPLVLAGACVVYSFVIYLDFSGYCDLAISVSRLLGLPLPENFDNPYASTNIREFWQRWHITFSRVLTSYIFVPVTRRLTKKWPQSRTRVMILGYLVTFGFCGYWHGPTANFVLWGLYHALGLVVYDLYQGKTRMARLKRKLAGQEPTGVKKAVGRLAATSATFAFVSVGWTLFVYPLAQLWR
jgi:alginate O-acetyltransferase complex protein AlgI